MDAALAAADSLIRGVVAIWVNSHVKQIDLRLVSACLVGVNDRSEGAGLGIAELAHTSLVNRRHAMAKETVKQRDKRKLDLQLDRELEGTFPASDPLKITRFCSPTPALEQSSKRKDTRRSGVRKRSFVGRDRDP
jgi:hypothetical protein